MPKTEVKDLKEKFAKAPKRQRQILIGAAVTFVATFLPWSSVSMGMFGGFNYSGWHGIGLLTVFASAGLILLWLLPLLGVSLKLPILTPELQKYLALAMLAGPLLWFLQSGFGFAYVGLGLWLALVSSALTVAIFFQKVKL